MNPLVQSIYNKIKKSISENSTNIFLDNNQYKVNTYVVLEPPLEKLTIKNMCYVPDWAIDTNTVDGDDYDSTDTTTDTDDLTPAVDTQYLEDMDD
jgi:hypothetical protein